MPPLRLNSMASGGNNSEFNLKTSAIKIEESSMLVEMKKEIVLENNFRQEAYFAGASIVKKEKELLTEDCSVDEYLPIGDKENHFLSTGSDIIDLHPSVVKVKEEIQFFQEESMEEDYFENHFEGLPSYQENGCRADALSPQEDGKENYDESSVVGTRSESNLKSLLSMPSSDRQLSCPQCPITFSAKMRTEYSLHLLSHGKTPLLCPICPKEFTLQQRLMCHLESQHLPFLGKQWYHCEICEARFDCSSTLAAHLRTLHADKYFYRSMCKLCLSKLERDRRLKCLLLTAHRNITHFEDSNSSLSVMCQENLFSCETEAERNNKSNKSEKHTYHLKNSQNDTADHLTSSNFSCPLCSAKFVRQGSFVEHLSAHSFRKLFQCTDCTSIFDSEKDFYSHWRYHKGELSYRCNFCALRFTRCCELVKHFKAVHSDKYWSLDNSSSTEYQQNSEQIHHTEVQNHENSASLTFSSPNATIKIESANHPTEDFHLAYSVSEQLYACDFCSTKFFYRNDLMRHLTKQHSETYRDPVRSEENGKQRFSSTGHNYEDLTNSIPTANTYGQSSQKCCSVTHDSENPSKVVSYPNIYAQSEQRFQSVAHSCESPANNALLSNTVSQTELISHTTAESYLCPCCPIRFVNLWDLTNHLKTSHAHKLCPSFGEQDSKLEKTSMQDCPNSEKERNPLSAPTSLIPSGFIQLEKASHTRVGLHQCQFCPARYSSRNTLMKHLTTCHENRLTSSMLHSEGEMFDVPDEFQEFSSSEELYLCEFCSKKFANSSHLMNHFTAQHSDKYLDPALFVRGNECKSKLYLSNATAFTNLRLKCPGCPSEFFWVSSMINHMKTHDTDRPSEKLQNLGSVNFN